jgi:hypothetical protein
MNLMPLVPRRYCFLYQKNDEKNIQGDVLSAYKLFAHPFVYHTAQYNYELLIDEPISDNPQYVNLQDYDIFWELVYKLYTDPSFITNQTYLNYGATDVQKDTDYINFTYQAQEWKIYTTYTRLADEYPVALHYLVFYDENDNISYNELYPMMYFFCDRLGKENLYTGVKEFLYQDPDKFQRFYVFYYGSEPSTFICRIQIRNHLVTTLGYTVARQRYPNLFIDAWRRIFVHTANNGYPIDYELAKSFIEANDIFHPEILLLLDWTCPLIVEGGLSDILPRYMPIEEEGNIESNLYIFYLSKTLNYITGTVITPSFITEANFMETDEYCSFIFGGVEWRVVKFLYDQP